jgi:hypothetical protein
MSARVAQRIRVALSRRDDEFPGKLFRYLPLFPPQIAPFVPFTIPEGACLFCYTTVSVHPRVHVFKSFITPHEAKYLIELGKSHLIRSGVVGAHGIDRARTSSGTRLPMKDAVVQNITRRLLFVVNNFHDAKEERFFKAGFSERLQLLRYQGLQQYYGHFDHFGGIGGPIAAAWRKRRERRGATVKPEPPVYDRAVTALLQLNNLSPEAGIGGFTAFPFSRNDVDLKKHPWEADERNESVIDLWERQRKRFNAEKMSGCHFLEAIQGLPRSAEGLADWLRVPPHEGQLIVFYSLYENGVSDPFAVHAGCPPLNQTTLNRILQDRHSRGLNVTASDVEVEYEKYAITKWFQIPIT